MDRLDPLTTFNVPSLPFLLTELEARDGSYSFDCECESFGVLRSSIEQYGSTSSEAEFVFVFL